MLYANQKQDSKQRRITAIGRRKRIILNNKVYREISCVTYEAANTTKFSLMEVFGGARTASKIESNKPLFTN